MAFARSASGPAGLSINTGAANTFGNNSSQPPAAGGLFGSTSATQSSAQPSSLFGGNTTNSQPAQSTSSLFGGGANNQQQQQQQQQPQQQQQLGGGGGGLFGTGMASTAKPGGLFGGLNTSTTTGGGGLFGGASNPTTATQPAGGSLFGQGAAQQPAQAAGGGLFGQQPKPAGSLFGGAAANTQPTSSLFGGGATNNAQNTGMAGATGGLFGQKPAAPAGGLFGGASTTGNQGNSLFSSMNQQPGAHQQQQHAAPALGSTMGQQSMVPGVRIDLSNLRNTTRFNDLQEDLQKEIAAIDAHIQGCMAQKDQVDAFLPQHMAQLQNIPGDVRFVSRKYAAVDSALGADLLAIKHMRDQVQADAAEARLSFHAINNLVLPSQYHVSPGFFGVSNARDQRREGGDADGNRDGEEASSSEELVNYFSRATDEMDEQIKRLQRTVKEIDTHLGGVQQNIVEQASRLQAGGGSLGGAGGQDERVMELYQVLRDFEESIVQVATVVGGAREGVTELQMNDFRGRASTMGFS